MDKYLPHVQLPHKSANGDECIKSSIIDNQASAFGTSVLTYESCRNEPQIKVMLRKGEHRDADVGENEIFGQKIEQFEYLFGPYARIVRQIVVGVMRLTNATKQHRHDSYRNVQRFQHDVVLI